jgi:hypothetical protein
MLSDATFILFSAATQPASTGSSFWPALAGAGIGGAVSIATTYLAERQRAKTAASDRQLQLQADAYLASRIIRLELVDTESVLRVATQRSSFHWPPTAGYQLPIAAWATSAAKLAAAATPEVWDQVAAVYSTFNYTNLLGDLNLETARSLLAETEAATAALTTAVAALES